MWQQDNYFEPCGFKKVPVLLLSLVLLKTFFFFFSLMTIEQTHSLHISFIQTKKLATKTEKGLLTGITKGITTRSEDN